MWTCLLGGDSDNFSFVFLIKLVDNLELSWSQDFESEDFYEEEDYPMWMI